MPVLQKKYDKKGFRAIFMLILLSFFHQKKKGSATLLKNFLKYCENQVQQQMFYQYFILYFKTTCALGTCIRNCFIDKQKKVNDISIHKDKKNPPHFSVNAFFLLSSKENRSVRLSSFLKKLVKKPSSLNDSFFPYFPSQQNRTSCSTPLMYAIRILVSLQPTTRLKSKAQSPVQYCTILFLCVCEDYCFLNNMSD